MKIPVYALMGTQKGSITLGRAFSGPVRPDLIKRAVKAEQAAIRQPYGADPEAGKRTSASYHGRRGIRHSMMNREMARMKRITSTRTLYMRARFVPQAVKGRKAHPPKAGKVWDRKVNKKERVAALLSAASATLNRDWVEKRQRVEHVKHIPLVVEDKLQGLTVLKAGPGQPGPLGGVDKARWEEAPRWQGDHEGKEVQEESGHAFRDI